MSLETHNYHPFTQYKGTVTEFLDESPVAVVQRLNSLLMNLKQVNSTSRLIPGKAGLALSLVGYPDKVEKATVFVFGNTSTCKGSETTKQATFSNEIGGASL